MIDLADRSKKFQKNAAGEGGSNLSADLCRKKGPYRYPEVYHGKIKENNDLPTY